VANELDRDDASYIAILQEIFKHSNELKLLKTKFAYIHAKFIYLP
jgi:hypothetical protein